MNTTCPTCTSNPSPDMLGRLFYDVHEGARIAKCRDCSQLYLVYFVEYQDDMLEYFCPVSAQQMTTLTAATNPATVAQTLIRNHLVFFKAPWRKEWIAGAQVLVQPRA